MTLPAARRAAFAWSVLGLAALAGCTSSGDRATQATREIVAPTFPDEESTSTSSSMSTGAVIIDDETVAGWNRHLVAAGNATTMDAVTAELRHVIDFDGSANGLANVIAYDYRSNLELPGELSGPVSQVRLVTFDVQSGTGTVAKLRNGEVTSWIQFRAVESADGARVMRITGANAA